MKVCVIGAGAAGLMSAIFAAKNGNDVTVLEHTAKAGTKIRATGNGKCNLTNERVSKDKYNHPDFVDKVLNEFSLKDTKDFFYESGLMLRERDGYVYPMSEQAATVVDILLSEVHKLGIQLKTSFVITRIYKEEQQFIINGTENLKCDKLIIATGGKAAPKMGSDGSGYQFAKAFGHKIVKPFPGLTGLVCNDTNCKSFAGVRSKGKIFLNVCGNTVYEEMGEIQFTEYGVSGIPVFNCCGHLRDALHNREKITVAIDFLPNLSKDDLLKFINMQIEKGKSILFAMKGLLNSKIANGIYEKINKTYDKKSKEFIEVIVNEIKYYEIDVIETRNFEQAQITCGGVKVSEINPATMESLITKGLFFAGEIIDADGLCGGYNLQFAWSTGAIAGKNC